jgi:hypothetical protein
MSREAIDELFTTMSSDVDATVVLTEALESGLLSTSEYAQHRYRVLGRSDFLRSLLIPFFWLTMNAARNLFRT